MLCINLKTYIPQYNLATEEYLLKQFEDDIFMLWQNSPSVIIGRYQNTFAEINIDYVEKNKIDVVRRITGGGTVFHDLGNVNFTFIARDTGNNQHDFKFFTLPILKYLKSLDIDARFEGRNDLTIDGKKFSGNAGIKYNGSILHHGTLLYSSKIDDLTAALKTSTLKFQGKAVKSVNARVTNISEHLKEKLEVDQFINNLFSFVVNTHDEAQEFTLDSNDFNSIQKLAIDKYYQWWWNYGESPAFNVRKEFKTNGGNFEVLLNVEKGIVSNIKIYGDFFTEGENDITEQFLTQISFTKEAFSLCIDRMSDKHWFLNVDKNEFLEGLFKNNYLA